MSEDSDSDYVEEVDLTNLDDENIMNDFNNDGPDRDTRMSFIPSLLSNEELSPEKQENMTKKFSEVFAQRYPSSGLRFFQGSFDDALNQSILNRKDARPLILYIRHNISIADNIFCMKFFCSEKIVNHLNENFVIWPWDRSNMTNYQQFLDLLVEKVGNEIALQIDSYSYLENQYPLLVCLSFNNGQYTILNIIDSEVQEEDMMFSMLCVARDDFDHRNLTTIKSRNEIWHIPNSHLASIVPQSDQFETIINS